MRRPPLLIAALALSFVGAALWSHACAARVSASETLARAADDSHAPPIPSPTSPRKIDEYGNLRWSDEKARLDNFAVELKNTPNAVGYIIGYAGRVAHLGDARRRIARASNYLVSARKIDPGNIITIDGGYKEDLTVELYIFPSGANPPQTSPTVDPSEVKLIKRRVKHRRAARRRDVRPVTD